MARGSQSCSNDEMVIPFYLANGATMKEALDWNISGCCENRIPNRETNVTGNARWIWRSAVEMTFRNGRLKVLKDLPFGSRPATHGTGRATTRCGRPSANSLSISVGTR